MSREAVIYGRTDGATGRANDDDYRRLQHRNAVVFSRLPIGDAWPWLPNAAAADRTRADHPRPVGEWVRTDPPSIPPDNEPLTSDGCKYAIAHEDRAT